MRPLTTLGSLLGPYSDNHAVRKGLIAASRDSGGFSRFVAKLWAACSFLAEIESKFWCPVGSLFASNPNCPAIVIEWPTEYISESWREPSNSRPETRHKRDELANQHISDHDRLVGCGRSCAWVLANVLRLALWCLLLFFLSLLADTTSDSSYSSDFRVFVF